MRPTFDVVRFAEDRGARYADAGEPTALGPASACATGHDPSQAFVSSTPSASSLQAAMTRMLDRSPQVSSVEVLGMFDRVPVVRMGSDELRALTLDHTRRVLSLIDGTGARHGRPRPWRDDER